LLEAKGRSSPEGTLIKAFSHSALILISPIGFIYRHTADTLNPSSFSVIPDENLTVFHNDRNLSFSTGILQHAI
jgi:hypothetical protein